MPGFLAFIAVFVVLMLKEHNFALVFLAIAIKIFFQKIADPKDIASTVGVSFTINHIVAVINPALPGVVWLTSPCLAVFIGAGFAFCYLILARNIPASPEEGNEARFDPFAAQKA